MQNKISQRKGAFGIQFTLEILKIIKYALTSKIDWLIKMESVVKMPALQPLLTDTLSKTIAYPLIIGLLKNYFQIDQNYGAKSNRNQIRGQNLIG